MELNSAEIIFHGWYGTRNFIRFHIKSVNEGNQRNSL